MMVRILGTHATASGFMKRMFSRAFLNDPGRQNEILELKPRFGRNRRAGVARAAQSVIRMRALGDELDAIRVPTLMISGEFDQIVPPAKAHVTTRKIRGARFVAVPGAGHACTIEASAAVNEAMASLLASVA